MELSLKIEFQDLKLVEPYFEREGDKVSLVDGKTLYFRIAGIKKYPVSTLITLLLKQLGIKIKL
jgi:hypothetical protein